MTRAAKKQLRKSRAAEQAENYAINRYIRELEASLKAAGVREEKLKDELQNLKKELKETRSQLKQARTTNKELKAKTSDLIQRFDSKIKKLNKPSTPKINQNGEKFKDGFGNVTVRVAERAKRTKDQWLAENKANFVEQFMQRLQNDFPNADKQKLMELRVKLDQLDAATIDAVLQGVDEEFRTQYYESDALATYVGKGQDEFLDRLYTAFGIVDKE